jgi:anti-anti-sigma factor
MNHIDQTIRLCGELDVATADGAMVRLLLALDRGEGLLVVDLRHLEFIDAAGLRMLVKASQAAVRRGRSLELANASPPLRRLFALVGLPGLISVRAVEATAG